MKSIAIIIALVLSGCAQITPATAPSACSPVRDLNGKIARSRTAVATFKFTNPCPVTGRSFGACPGYVVDHIDPLCNCGADDPTNMQWQTIADSKVKDQWERKVCRGASE